MDIISAGVFLGPKTLLHVECAIIRGLPDIKIYDSHRFEVILPVLSANVKNAIRQIIGYNTIFFCITSPEHKN